MVITSMTNTSAYIHIKIPPINLHPGQRRILESPARFKVISAGRKFGKTLLAIEWLTLMDGGAIEGFPVAYFAPRYQFLLDIWDNIKRTLKPVTRRSPQNEKRIELITGGVIEFWSLENDDAGRSRKYKRVVVDEAAHTPNLKAAWDESIRQTMIDFKGEAMIISTPNGLNYFYDLYKRSLADKEWASFQMPTSANPYISPDEIEQARRELPDLVFRQEYLAEFVSMTGGLVKQENIIYAEPMITDDAQIIVGVDLAISKSVLADYTAIVTAIHKDGKVIIADVQRGRWNFREVVETIKNVAQGASLVVIESVQYQAAVVQELIATTQLPVIEYVPDKNKITRFLPLLARIEHGQVMFSHSLPRWYFDELLSFPVGQHCDCVDASVYAALVPLKNNLQILAL
jgi:predicted phage terminase large subunit-like protein